MNDPAAHEAHEAPLADRIVGAGYPRVARHRPRP